MSCVCVWFFNLRIWLRLRTDYAYNIILLSDDRSALYVCSGPSTRNWTVSVVNGTCVLFSAYTAVVPVQSISELL